MLRPQRTALIAIETPGTGIGASATALVQQRFAVHSGGSVGFIVTSTRL